MIKIKILHSEIGQDEVSRRSLHTGGLDGARPSDARRHRDRRRSGVPTMTRRCGVHHSSMTRMRKEFTGKIWGQIVPVKICREVTIQFDHEWTRINTNGRKAFAFVNSFRFAPQQIESPVGICFYSS